MYSTAHIRPCTVKGCYDISSKRFRVPIRNLAIKQIWLERIADQSLTLYSDKELYHRVFICGAHFIKECRPTSKLLHNALPSINVPGFSEEPTLQNSFFTPQYAKDVSASPVIYLQLEETPPAVKIEPPKEEVYEANQLCRLCFSIGNVDVFSYKYYKKFLRDIVKILVPIDIKKEDISTVVCENCKCEVIRFYNFMLKSLQVEEYFRTISAVGNDDAPSGELVVVEPLIEIEDEVETSDSNNVKIEFENQVETSDSNNIKEESILASLLSDKNKIALALKRAPESHVGANKDYGRVKKNANYVPFKFIKTLHSYAKNTEKVTKRKDYKWTASQQIEELDDITNGNEVEVESDTIICIHCNKIIENIDEFHIHCKSENHDPIFTCTECNRIFKNSIDLEIHLEIHRRNEYSMCDRCGKQFNKRESLHVHLNTVHGKRELKHSCEICPKKFATNYRLKLHMRIHTNDRPYCCEQCGAVFSLLANLKNHQMIHSDYKPHACLICNKAFRRKYKLAVHMTKHTGERKFTCEICGVAYKRKVNLTRHNRKHHVNAEGDEYEERIRNCTHCDYTCKFSGQLKLHMLKVHKSYTCTLCNMSFKNYQPYYNHRFKHYPNKKRFVCPYCNKRFANTTLLNVHLVVHTGKKNFECEICKKRFSQKPHLQSHLLIHTGERPHKCRYCTKSFAHLSTLVVHERIHTGETPYVCEFCNKGFGHLTNYKKHVFSQHGVIMPKKRDYPPARQGTPTEEIVEEIEMIEGLQTFEYIDSTFIKSENFENVVEISEDVDDSVYE